MQLASETDTAKYNVMEMIKSTTLQLACITSIINELVGKIILILIVIKCDTYVTKYDTVSTLYGCSVMSHEP